MNTDEALVRAQLEATERANERMLQEIKSLTEDKAAMIHLVRRRYYAIKTDMSFALAGCRDVVFNELGGILASFEDEEQMNGARNYLRIAEGEKGEANE